MNNPAIKSKRSAVACIYLLYFGGTMYKCETHGVIETDWCDDCAQIQACDCSDMTTTRIKDFIYDSKSGERTVTITLHHCETCGDAFAAEI